MKNLFVLLFFLSIFQATASDSIPGIIALNFSVNNEGHLEMPDNLNTGIPQSIENFFAKYNFINTLSRKNYLDLLKEIEFQNTFNKEFDDQTKSKLEWIGADYIISGEISINKTYIKINARITGISKSNLICGESVVINSTCDISSRLISMHAYELYNKLLLSFSLKILPTAYAKLISERNTSLFIENILKSICTNTRKDARIAILPIQKNIAIHGIDILRTKSILQIVNQDKQIKRLDELLPIDWYDETLRTIPGIKLTSRHYLNNLMKKNKSSKTYKVNDTSNNLILSFEGKDIFDFLVVPSININIESISWTSDSSVYKCTFLSSISCEFISTNDYSLLHKFDTTLAYTYRPFNTDIEITNVTCNNTENEFIINTYSTGQNLINQQLVILIEALYPDNSLLKTNKRAFNLKGDGQSKIGILSDYKILNITRSFEVRNNNSFRIPYSAFLYEIRHPSYWPQSDEYVWVAMTDAVVDLQKKLRRSRRYSSPVRFSATLYIHNTETNSYIKLDSSTYWVEYFICLKGIRKIRAYEKLWYSPK